MKAVREDVETSADLNLLFSLNLSKTLLQEFGILKLMTLRIHTKRVINIFNLWYCKQEFNTRTSSLGEIKKGVK